MNDISDLIKELKQRGVKKVALQFPEGLKRQSAGYTASLKEAGFNVVVSGDPCYGACDLALDTLEFAEVLVHVGHTPVDPQERVIFEPYRVDFAVGILEKALPFIESLSIALVTTVQHVHLIPEMEAFLRSKGIEVVVSTGTTRTPCRGQVLGCSFGAAKVEGVGEILFVGTGVFHAIGCAIATKKRVIALDPLAGFAQVVDGDMLLRRRFSVMERAGGAKNYGIILSTKSGQKRKVLSEHLLTLSPNTILVTMREVDPDELINLGLDCYVNTACPRLAYDDQIRFPMPVLSPQEFEILCGTRTWDDYAIDEIS